MIDKGTDVGLPFTGAAPDLGASEFGATGTGGSTTAVSGGVGGAPGSGGSSAITATQSAGGGCSCRFVGDQPTGGSGLAWLAFFLVALRCRVRR
jgi:hypothetical protein